MEVDVLKKVPVSEQDPKVRATNFDEVNLGYTKEEAMAEATRCLNCKNARCITGCPVNINIPAFIAKVKDGDVSGAYDVISKSSSLPAVCGRVCPQETQCEAQCIRGIKGEAVSIGRLERFVADTAKEMGIKPQLPADMVKKGKKVAIVDDVISTGGSLLGLEKLVEKAGGTVAYKAFVLAEGDAAKRDDVIYLATIPLL